MLDQNLDLTSVRPDDALLAFSVPPTVMLRVTQDPRRFQTWALALTSKGVPSLLRFVDGTFELHVAYELAPIAEVELNAIDEEERDNRRAERADAALEQRPVSKHAGVGAVILAALLLGFFAVTGARAGGSEWFAAGASDAEHILHGEWWRAVTGLTLHADTAHVLSNVGMGTLAIGAVMRSEGIGWGSALVLAAGTVGNLMNAWAHQSLHSSVGFSTALFGAIGLLGGIAYVQSRRRSRSSRPAWSALAGTLALLALMGTSEKANVDMLAHVFGCFAGVSLGAFVAWRQWRPTSSAGQWAAGLGAAASVLGAWVVALG